jgi:hypothetical protein
MDDDSQQVTLPPFQPKYRASGVLLHVASLPSNYRIGDVMWGRLHSGGHRQLGTAD